MQLNAGWIVLYTMFKDALLQKTGIVKVWWEEREQEERETYYGITDAQYQALAYAVEMSDGAMVIAEHTQHGDEQPESPAEDANEPQGAY